jgi:hypothetical protein
MPHSSDLITSAFNQVKKDLRMLTNPRTYQNMTQNQIIGALTVMLLIVGVAAGVYLGGQSQELRQQASSVYPTCGASSVSDCLGGTAGVKTCAAFTGGPGICQNTNTNPSCTCVPLVAVSPTPPGCTSSSQCSNNLSGHVCLPNGSCGCNSIVDCNVGFKCENNQCTPINCAPSSSDSLCQNRAQGEICDSSGAINKICQNNGTANGCNCVEPPLQCVPAQVAPLQPNRDCVADDNTTDDCVGFGVEGNSCQISSVCGGGSGTCRQIAGQGDSSRGFCTCARGGGGPTNPPTSPSITVTQPPVSITDVPVTVTNPPVTVTNPPTSISPSITLSLTPTETPILAPLCVNVIMNNPASTTPNTPPSLNDVVTLTCSQVAGATRYEFRFKLPNGSYVELQPSASTPYVSEQYQITAAGSYSAACRPCSGVDDSTCSAWEN